MGTHARQVPGCSSWGLESNTLAPPRQGSQADPCLSHLIDLHESLAEGRQSL